MRARLGLGVVRWASFSLPLLGAASAFAQTAPPPSGYPAATAPANTGDSPALEAGGLRPPGELVQEEAPPSETQKELERSDREDSGRGLEFVWLNVEAGYQHANLTAFSGDDDLVPGVDASQDGFVFGGGAGVRLLYFTLGARFRFGSFDSWQLWSLLGEAGVHFPLGAFDPYVRLGVGYASVGSFNTGSFADDGDISVRGVDVRAAVGLDYYLSRSFSLGAQLSGDVLVLNRPGVSGVDSGAYADDGSGTGLSLYATAVAGLHF